MSGILPLSTLERPERVQQEYVLLRRFLIENPYTTTAQLRKAFFQARHIEAQEVGELYDDCEVEEPCWNCDRLLELTVQVI